MGEDVRCGSQLQMKAEDVHAENKCGQAEAARLRPYRTTLACVSSSSADNPTPVGNRHRSASASTTFASSHACRSFHADSKSVAPTQVHSASLMVDSTRRT